METGSAVEGDEAETNISVVGSFPNSDAGDEGGWANFDNTPPAMFSGHGHGAAPGWTSFDDATPSIAPTVVDQSAEIDSLKAQLADALASNRRLTEQLSAAVDTVSTLRGEVDSLKRGSGAVCAVAPNTSTRRVTSASVADTSTPPARGCEPREVGAPVTGRGGREEGANKLGE